MIYVLYKDDFLLFMSIHERAFVVASFDYQAWKKGTGLHVVPSSFS